MVFKNLTEKSRAVVYVDVRSCFRHLSSAVSAFLLLLLLLVVVVELLASASGVSAAAAAAATALRTAGWSCSVLYFLS